MTISAALRTDSMTSPRALHTPTCPGVSPLSRAHGAAPDTGLERGNLARELGQKRWAVLLAQSRFGKGSLLCKGGKMRGCIMKKSGGSERGRRYKKDEEVMTGESFKEDGNKGKTRRRRQ